MKDYSSDEDHHHEPKIYPLPCKSQKRWQHVVTVLSKPLKNHQDLFRALYALAGEKQKKYLSTKGLGLLLQSYMGKEDRKAFYEVTLPFIQECALNLPALFRGNEISLLAIGCGDPVEWTEEQVASLLAMSFFGLHTWERGSSYPRFRITNLFGYTEPVYMEKIRCILHYFYMLANANKQKKQFFDYNNKDGPKRTISIYRHIPKNAEYQQLRNEYLSQNVASLCDVQFHIRGSIEDCDNALQVDFANKYIGGGVLGSGCVQEEIRFLINPECLVALLLCEEMQPNEAIAVVGTKQYSKYKGYGSSFKFAGSHQDRTPVKEYGQYYKTRNCIIAIDAKKFPKYKRSEQYKQNDMKRELLKCYTGFSIPTHQTNLDESKEVDKKLSIATGNWGCGVFGGDIELKFILQWMAASLADRKIQYFAFGDKGCKYVESFIEIMHANHVTVGMLWNYLCLYAKYRKGVPNSQQDSCIPVFRFIVGHMNRERKRTNAGHELVLKANPTLEQKKKNDVHPGKWPLWNKKNGSGNHKQSGLVSPEYKEEAKEKVMRQKKNRECPSNANPNSSDNEVDDTTNDNNDNKKKQQKKQSDSFDDKNLDRDSSSSRTSCGLQADEDEQDTKMKNDEQKESDTEKAEKPENEKMTAEGDEDADEHGKGANGDTDSSSFVKVDNAPEVESVDDDMDLDDSDNEQNEGDKKKKDTPSKADSASCNQQEANDAHTMGNDDNGHEDDEDDVPMTQ